MALWQELDFEFWPFNSANIYGPPQYVADLG